jgi:hypothetical protein
MPPVDLFRLLHGLEWARYRCCRHMVHRMVPQVMTSIISSAMSRQAPTAMSITGILLASSLSLSERERLWSLAFEAPVW